jgi:HEPN domain-containing protein
MNIPGTIPHVHTPSARSDAAYAPEVDAFSVCNGACAPHERHPLPGELVSLWDMLRINAHAFVQLMTGISKAETNLAYGQERCAQMFATLNPDSQGLTLSATRDDAPNELKAHIEKFSKLTDEIRKMWTQTLDKAEKSCKPLQLQSALAYIVRMRRVLDRLYLDNILETPKIIADMQNAMKEFGARVLDELNSRTFMFIPPQRVEFWSEAPLLSKKVQRRYRKACDDMVEAGKCLAAGRFTACVFHLMRVAEIGAKSLIKKLKLTISHKATLGVIARDIDAEIVKMPTATQKETDRKAAFSKTADHLSHITNGWRNKTMHPGESYNEDQAMLMFKNVREFMNLLIELR